MPDNEEVKVEEVTEDENENIERKPLENDDLSPEQAYEARQIDKAVNDGWKDYDDWVEAGRNPDEWAPASVFNANGEWIKKLNASERNFNDRIQGLNQFHEASMNIKIAELQAEKAALIREGGDRAVQEVSQIDNKITALASSNQAPPSVPQLDVWNRENPWINDGSPRAIYAQTNFQAAFQKNAHLDQQTAISNAISYVNQQDRKEYGKKNMPKKESVPISEGGSAPANKSSKNALTWDNLSREEQMIYDSMPSSWKDKNDFLKSVKDSRKQ